LDGGWFSVADWKFGWRAKYLIEFGRVIPSGIGRDGRVPMAGWWPPGGEPGVGWTGEETQAIGNFKFEISKGMKAATSCRHPGGVAGQ